MNRELAAAWTGERAATSFVFLLALAVPLTALSLFVTGFEFGVGNNAFHVPFVLSLSQQPPFLDDALYQSLRNFAAGPFVLLRLVCTEANVERVFLVCHIVSRGAAVFAVLYLARTLEVTRRAGLLFVGVGFVLSPLVLGSSGVGEHGLFISSFTHSELTWPFLLGALAASHNRQYAIAAALAALCFVINAFVGVWVVLALATGALLNLRDHRVRDLWQLPVIFVLISLPVVIWIASTFDSAGAVVDFSFRTYIRQYYPNHFLIESAKPAALVELAALSLAAFLCAREALARRLSAEILGFAGVFAIGTFLPYVFDHRVIFNLHLLRVDGVLQFLFVLLALVVSFRRFQDDRWFAKATALILAASVINGMSAICALAAVLAPRLDSRLGRWQSAIVVAMAGVVLHFAVGTHGNMAALFILAAVLAVRRDAHEPVGLAALAFSFALALISLLTVIAQGGGVFRLAILAICWVYVFAPLVPRLRARDTALPLLAIYLAFQICAVNIRFAQKVFRGEGAQSRSFSQLSNWLRAQSDMGPLLAPIETNPPPMDSWEPASRSLQLYSRQQVWVDWKSGAAVMWEPGLYQSWWSRYTAVRALRTPEQFYDYAVQNGLRWMLLPLDPSKATSCPRTHVAAAFEAAPYRVCLVAQQSASTIR